MNETIVSAQPVRARWFQALAALVLLLALAMPASAVAAQDEEDEDGAVAGLAEVPSFGGMRPGPINPTASAGTATAEVQPEGVAPVAIEIDAAAVDAVVERSQIDENGVMENPTGPWVVSWYEDLAALGEGSNVVMAGHVDYWTTGPAVFANVPNLGEGEVIRVVAEDGEVFEYAVEWGRLYDVATELTPEVIQTEIVGDTDEESLTLITCGGEFDAATGEYVSRYVVRATKI